MRVFNKGFKTQCFCCVGVFQVWFIINYVQYNKTSIQTACWKYIVVRDKTIINHLLRNQ